LKRHRLEVRPSDALALAVRLRTPIFVHPDIINTQAETGRLFEDGNYYKGDTPFFERKN
jgi:bifunctional DNase/RNase